MGKKNRRGRVEHTDDWGGLLPFFAWPEQTRYEEIRPLVLFGDPVAERAEEVGSTPSGASPASPSACPPTFLSRVVSSDLLPEN